MRIPRHGYWHPAGTDRSNYDRPQVGECVAWERCAWLVTHVRVDDPTDQERERLRHYKPEARERRLPYSLTMQRIHGPKHERENSRQEVSGRVAAVAYFQWERYDEAMVDAKKDAERSSLVLEKRIARAGVGLCIRLRAGHHPAARVGHLPGGQRRSSRLPAPTVPHAQIMLRRPIFLRGTSGRCPTRHALPD